MNFAKNVIRNLKTRCTDYCYRVRLEQTAKYAKKSTDLTQLRLRYL